MSGLELKCRPKRLASDLPGPRLADFSRAPRSSAEFDFDSDGPIRLHAGDAQIAVVLCAGRPRAVPLRADADVSDFCFVDRLAAQVRLSPAGATTRRQIAVAVSVPLLLVAPMAHAAPPAMPPPSEAPTDRDPVVTEPQTGPTTPTQSSTPGPTAGSEGPSPTAPAPTTAPVDGLDLAGAPLWEGLMGHRVRLEVRAPEGGSATVEGEVVAQSTDQVAIAVGVQGTLASVDKNAVRSVLVDPQPADREGLGHTGTGLLIGGGVVIGLGVPLIALGIAFSGYYSSPDVALGLGLSGALLAAGGIPMVVFGAKRRREHRRAFGYAQLAPNVRVGRDGAVGGVRLRF